MVIVLLLFGFLPRQAQACNGSGPQTAEWIPKQNKVQEGDKQEKMSRVEEANKTEEKELSHLKKNGGMSGQGSSGLSIYEEERVLRLMEEQEVPAGSRKVYRFISA